MVEIYEIHHIVVFLAQNTGYGKCGNSLENHRHIGFIAHPLHISMNIDEMVLGAAELRSGDRQIIFHIGFGVFSCLGW